MAKMIKNQKKYDKNVFLYEVEVEKNIARRK